MLYIFLQLLIQYLKGEEFITIQIEKERVNNIFIISTKKRIDHPWPFSYYTNSSVISKSFFRKVKQGVLQFVLIKPITAILSLILYQYGLYEEGNLSMKNFYLYISITNNISISVKNIFY